MFVGAVDEYSILGTKFANNKSQFEVEVISIGGEVDESGGSDIDEKLVAPVYCSGGW